MTWLPRQVLQPLPAYWELLITRYLTRPAGTTAVAGNILGYGGAGLSKAAGVVVKGGRYAAGKTVQYIGIPLASAGIAVGGGTVGTVVGGVGAVSGGALRVAGRGGFDGHQGLGNVIAGSNGVGRNSSVR